MSTDKWKTSAVGTCKGNEQPQTHKTTTYFDNKFHFEAFNDLSLEFSWVRAFRQFTGAELADVRLASSL